MARVKALEAREEFLSCGAGGTSAPARDLPTIEAACLTCALVQLSHNGSEKGDGSKSFKAAASPSRFPRWSRHLAVLLAALMAAESLFQYRVV